MTVHIRADARKVIDEPSEKSTPVVAPAAPTAPSAKAEWFDVPPEIRRRIGLIGIALGISAAISAMATLIAAFATRRRQTAPRAHYLFGPKPARHYGYGRFRVPRLGSAYLAYTYKLPVIRYRLPEMANKLPPIRVRLPIPGR